MRYTRPMTQNLQNTASTELALPGRWAAEVEPQLAAGEKTVAVGRDGRLSGPELAAALIRGLTSTGVNVIDVGAVTTPKHNTNVNRRQYYDERASRYYYYDPGARRYYWEDGSPRN